MWNFLKKKWEPKITTDPEKLPYEEIIAGVMGGYISHRNDFQKLMEKEKIRKQKYLEGMNKYIEEHKDYYSRNNDTTIIARKGK